MTPLKTLDGLGKTITLVLEDENSDSADLIKKIIVEEGCFQNNLLNIGRTLEI